MCELINGALIQAREASDELRSYSESMELDPARMDAALRNTGVL